MNDKNHWYNLHWWYWNVFWPKEQERLENLRTERSLLQPKKE